MRFIAISLMVLVGCGDNSPDGDDGPEDHDVSAGIDPGGANVGKLLPRVCAARQWSTPFVEDKDLQLRVVPVTQGTAVLGVPLAGGQVYGFIVDPRGQIVGDPAGTRVLDGTFTNLSVSRQDGRVVAALVEDGKTQIRAFKQDLSENHLLDTVGGDQLVADTTMIKTRGQRMTISAGTDGIITTPFDLQWASLGAAVFAADAPISITSTEYGDDAMIAWSTEHQCTVARVAAKRTMHEDFACANNRIAADYSARRAQMVYEAGPDIHIADVSAGNHFEIASHRMIAPHARSPRIVFDGDRYWISYLNARGEVTVGYLDDDRHIVSMGLTGVQPMAQAYDLAVIDGAVWVYALDGISGYTGTQMCLERDAT